MKKLVILTLASIVTLSSFSQDTIISRQSLTQSQNKLLMKYGINYIGFHTRYMVASGNVLKLRDTNIQHEMTSSFNRFQRWNNGYFSNIPDTTVNDRYKIIVNDYNNNIKSIEIIESYSSATTRLSDNTNFYWGNFGFTLLVEDLLGNITELVYSEADTDLDCPQCYIE
jgi:hypothetical protein